MSAIATRLAESAVQSLDRYPVSTSSAEKASVASLNPVDIARMTRSELVEMILASRLPFLGETACERLPHLDRWTLERLVYLGRQCCRNQGY